MTLLAARNHPIDCGLATTSFTRTFAKRTISGRAFDITATPIERVISSASTSTVSKDKNGGSAGPALKVYQRRASASYAIDYKVAAAVRSDGYFKTIALSSDSPGILSHPSSSGVATYQSAGQCALRATSSDGEVALAQVTASATSPATIDTFQSWAAGSLAKHCADQINGLIAGKPQTNVFTTYSPSGFSRNAACWANGIDLSCASPWNNQAGSLYAGTLISPRHMAFCDHAAFYPTNGGVITFVSAAGIVITRTIASSVKVAGADIRVALLNADVSGGVTFARVLPSNWQTYLPGIDFVSTVPVMCLNQTERASIAALRSLGASFVNAYPPAYAAYYGEIIRFDSGNPVFLVINGQPVLVGVFTTGGAGGGSFVSHYTNAVNAAMTSLGGGYQLTPVDLSGFTNYA